MNAEVKIDTDLLHLWDNNGEEWWAARNKDHLRKIVEEACEYFDPDYWEMIDDDEEIMFWWHGEPEGVYFENSIEHDGHPNPDWTHEIHAKASAWANGLGPGLVASRNY